MCEMAMRRRTSLQKVSPEYLWGPIQPARAAPETLDISATGLAEHLIAPYFL
jgi:hypothetical protein